LVGRRSSATRWVDSERAKAVGVTGVILALACGLVPRSAPGSTIDEQRALLPPAASCDDPVVGVWQAHNYRTRQGHWAEHSIEVRRASPSSNDLVGRALYPGWSGSPEVLDSPGCDRTEHRVEVAMPARGRNSGLDVEFWGVEPWEIQHMHCGDSGSFCYNLDHFSGTIDPEIQQFQSVNNDGELPVDERVVFRRIRRLEGPATALIQPPPFQPASNLGCEF
jgi:hypothetical protein